MYYMRVKKKCTGFSFYVSFNNSHRLKSSRHTDMFGRTHPLFFFLSASDCCAELDALHADDREFKLETESVDS